MSCRRYQAGYTGEIRPWAVRRLAGDGSAAAPATPAPSSSASNTPAAEAPAKEVTEWRRKFDRLQAEAKSREEQARDQGQQEGYQAGYRDGQAEAARRAAAEVEQAVARAAASVEEVLATRRRMRRQLEEDLVTLAVSIARRVLNRELHVDNEALWGIVRAVIDKLEAREIHRLRVAPADAPVVQTRLKNLPERLEVAPDPALERGGIIFETVQGEIDASVETQLEEIERGLADAVRRSPA